MLPCLGGATLTFLTMNKFFRLLVGLVFLLSGFLKAINTADFANLMSQYGASWFGFGAPIIVLLEIFLGILLIFDFYPKAITWSSVAFICVVSSIYLYGVLAKGIIDCGCFGPHPWLNSKPWLTFSRNGFLITLLIPSLIKTETSTAPTIPSIVFMAIIAVIVMFMCGFSFRGADCLNKQHTFQPIALSDSPLADYVECHPDSSYLVFAFSYNCPYCQNSIGNVNQYIPMGVVDNVIGLAIEDSIARKRFYRLFDIDFPIREISSVEMFRLSNTMPTTFIIRHDSIINQLTGMVVSPALQIP